MDVQDSTHEKQGDAQPRQDETVAKVSFVQDSWVIKNLLSVEGGDEASGKVRETCKRFKINKQQQQQQQNRILKPH